jgi:hypothetical protein
MVASEEKAFVFARAESLFPLPAYPVALSAPDRLVRKQTSLIYKTLQLGMLEQNDRLAVLNFAGFDHSQRMI